MTRLKILFVILSHELIKDTLLPQSHYAPIELCNCTHDSVSSLVSYYFVFPPISWTVQARRVCLKYNVYINISSYRFYYHQCMLWINCIDMVWLLLFFALLCTCSLCLRCISSSSTCQLTVYFCYVLSIDLHTFLKLFFCYTKKKKKKKDMYFTQSIPQFL